MQPTVYLNKLPEAFSPGALVLVADPMIATGACEAALLLHLQAAECVLLQVGHCAPV